ncbi:MAG: hypothetical protein ACR2NN_20710 [Bryobacteraceae bacterium]
MWLNDTGLPVHIEPTWVTVLQIEDASGKAVDFTGGLQLVVTTDTVKSGSLPDKFSNRAVYQEQATTMAFRLRSPLREWIAVIAFRMEMKSPRAAANRPASASSSLSLW